MTIIFQLGNEFWIESILVSVGAIGTSASVNDDFTLERAGVYLGHAGTITVLNGTENLSFRVVKTDNSDVVVGDAITGLRVRTSNHDGVSASVSNSVRILVFMRGSIV